MSIPVLTSRIDSVTVYREGALVCRAALVLAAQPVPAQVKLINLPLSLDDDSLRVRVEGEGGELPVATELRVALDLAVVEQDLPPPDDAALKQAQRSVAQLGERLAHLRAQRARLERLQVFERPPGKRGGAPVASPVRARLALLEFRQQAIAALDERIQHTRAEERRAVLDREDLEHRHRAASQARQARPHELRKAVIIALRGHTIPTHPVRVIVEYMVPGARWAPAYAIHLSRDMSQANVSVRAVVAQRTGEDWRGVKLTLSTADAHRWTELPELQVLRIGRRQPPVQRRGWRAPPIGARELYTDFDRSFAAAPPQPPRRAFIDDLDDEGASHDGRSHTQSGIIRERDEARPRPSAPPSPSAPMPPRSPPPMPMRGAPAPPRGASVPMEQARSGGPPPAMSRSADLLQAKGGGLASAKVGGLASAVAGAFGGAGEGGAFAPQEPSPLEAEHAAAPEQLAYGALRMPGPKDSRRGGLVVAQRRERYLEMLWVRELTRELDVVALIDGAVSGAEQAGQGGPPPRHQLAASQDGFDYVYAADSVVDIPADGEFHGIPLMARPAALELGYVVVPRESCDVFRQIELKNPLDAPLLPGPADVYVGGDYLLSADLRAAPARGALRIGLGVEPSIKVSRNTSFTEESAGLMGGSLALRHEISIEVANRRERPIDIEVQERLPTLREREDEIQLDLVQVDPPWAEFEPEDYPLKGGHRWQLQVPPAQSKKLRVAYVIKISAKKELVGGNRREQ